MVRFCRGRHFSPKGIVGKIRRIPSIVFQQQYPVRGNSVSYEKIFVADGANRKPKPEQTFRPAFGRKDFALCTAVRMVSRPRAQDHSSVSHDRL